MIKLTRIRTPQAIPRGLRGKHRVNKERQLLEGKRDNTLEFKSNYWQSAKAQLKAESGGKCAYCEADTQTVAYGDVEHFRPKSRYWWLAYCYDNYLYVCQICNSHFKRDHFPISGVPMPEPAVGTDTTDEDIDQMAGKLAPDPLHDTQGMPMETFQEQSLIEDPHLINPYVVDPKTLLKWHSDPELREVTVVARDDSPEAQRAVRAAETYYGLNREELRRKRGWVLRKLSLFKDVLEADAVDEELRSEILSVILEMMSHTAPFAGMVRYFVREVWQLQLDE
jgi:uncharacterized protein (TIGR02646 family)